MKPTELQLYQTEIDTPLGKMIAIASGRGLCGFEFVEHDRAHALFKRLNLAFPHSNVKPHFIKMEQHKTLSAIKDWSVRYFSSKFRLLPNVPLDFVGTPFELKVWNALLSIPSGETKSYGEIARQIGCGSARAVGGAVGRNPLSLIVPCHRVIGSGQTLTGYGGGLDRKQWLLKHEGLSVQGDRSCSLVSEPNKNRKGNGDMATKKMVSKKSVYCVCCPKWEIKRPEKCSNTLVHQGKKRLFCTKKCKERFVKAPEKFL